MKPTAFVCLLFFVAASGFAQKQTPLCPKHIETPTYPQIGRMANIAGTVVLKVTVGADGRVTDVAAATPRKVLQILAKGAAENLRRWTFEKPPSAPYVETITYDYEFDSSLPPAGGSSNLPNITKVSFDLPDQVTIAANERILDTSHSKPR